MRKLLTTPRARAIGGTSQSWQPATVLLTFAQHCAGSASIDGEGVFAFVVASPFGGTDALRMSDFIVRCLLSKRTDGVGYEQQHLALAWRADG